MQDQIDNHFLLQSPFILGIIITNRCNLNCIHCMNFINDNDAVELTNKEIKNLIDECVEHQIPYIDFNGGEPFLRNDFDEILDYAIEKKRIISISTNGTLINNNWLDKYSGKISLLKISIDSSCLDKHENFRATNGCFQKTINNVIKAVNKGYQITIQTVISKLNQYHLKNIVALCKEVNVNGLHCKLLLPGGRAKKLSHLMISPQELKTFINEHKSIQHDLKQNHSPLQLLEELPYFLLPDKNNKTNIPCRNGAALTEMVVSHEGYALPSPSFMSVRCFWRVKDLNIREKDLINIYKNSNLFKHIRNVENIHDKCGRCKYLLYCGGGLRAAAYTFTGDIYAEDPYCWYNAN